VKKQTMDIAASVKARLFNIAGTTGKPYDELLKLFAMERLLYRLGKSRFKAILTLKGALFFLVRNVPGRRTTLDIDFLARNGNDPEKIAGMVGKICSVPVKNDGIRYDAGTITAAKTREDAEYSGVRVKLTAYIERTRIPVQLDFGFGDVIYPGAEKIDYPVLLDFPAPRLKVYPPETVVSEKFEAMVRLGDLNSRMKDFYDLWLIFRSFKLDKTEVAKAVKKTFERRHTQLPKDDRLFSEDIYDKNSDRQILWSAFLRKNNIEKAPKLLSDTAAEIRKQLLKSVELIRKGKKL